MAWVTPIMQSVRRVLTRLALIALAAELSDVHYTPPRNLHHADSLSAPAAFLAQLILGRSAEAARISAQARNRKARASSRGQAGSWTRRRAGQSNGDEVLEIPQAIDSRSAGQVDESNATRQNGDNYLQLGQTAVADDASQFFPEMVRPIRTLQDYENEAKNRPVPTVCIGPKWWWTLQVPVCKPIGPTPQFGTPP